MPRELDILIRNIERLPRDMDVILEDVFEKNKSELEEAQRDQMELGQTSLGGEIGVLRNPAYARRKKAKGGRAGLGMVDLKNMGAFQRAITAQVAQNAINITSSDSKSSDLKDKYGDEIFGYNSETILKMRELWLDEELRFEIKRYLNAV